MSESERSEGHGVVSVATTRRSWQVGRRDRSLLLYGFLRRLLSYFGCHPNTDQ